MNAATLAHRYGYGPAGLTATHVVTPTRPEEGPLLVTLSDDLSLCDFSDGECGGLVSVCCSGYTRVCDSHGLADGYSLPIPLEV